MPLTGVVALDGPSGTGKSSVARSLARALGACYLDTGAMYRAVTWAVLRAGVDLNDTDAVADVAGRVRLEITTDPDDQQVSADGQRVDRQIRSVPVTAAVSEVSAVPEVRATLVAAQRAIIDEALGRCGIVVEGRDIGTVVAPDAALKVFLTASAEERAARRSRQVGRTGAGQVEAVQEAMRRRDTFDSSRVASPLRPADDAVEVDTTHLSLTEVVERMVELARDRGLVPEGHR
ncbi:MAG TPA: (d)CMP kinase [Mycobacteriales bacterium]